LEQALKIIQFKPFCLEQGCHPTDQAVHGSILSGLKHLQGWGIHTLSGKPIPVTLVSHMTDRDTHYYNKEVMTFLKANGK